MYEITFAMESHEVKTITIAAISEAAALQHVRQVYSPTHIYWTNKR